MKSYRYLSHSRSSVPQELRNAYRFRYVSYSFVQTNLKLKYRRSYLGFLWTVIAPMLHYFIMGLVFTLLLGRGRPGYFAYYFSGALFFAMISGVLNRSVTTFLINEHFIKKVNVPKLTYVLNSVGIELTNFFLSGTSLLILGMISGQFQFSKYSILCLVPVLLCAIALAGIACMLSVAAVYFRDLINIIPAIIQALFFATPVIYDESMIPANYSWLIHYNPLFYFLKLFREPLLSQSLPSLNIYVVSSIFSISCLVAGLFLLVRFDNKIVFRL